MILINIATISMMSAKMATLDLLKTKISWNKSYDITIFVHDVTHKVLSLESNYIIDVAMLIKVW